MMNPATVFLLLLALAFVAAITRNSSDCINTATYGGYPRKCHCPYNLGHGDFCCALQGQDICTLMDNLVLETTAKVSMLLALPCHQAVSSFMMHVDDAKEATCDFTISTSGTYVEKGVIFSDRVLISIKFTEVEKPLVVKFYIRNGREIFSSNYRTRTMDMFDILPYEVSIKVKGEDLKFFVEHSLEYNIWSLSGCNTIISFRRHKNQKAIQDQVPGICVKRDLKFLKAQGNVMAGNLCDMSKVDDHSPFTDQTTATVNQVIQNYQSLAETYPNFGDQDVETSCDALSHYYNKCPSYEKQKALDFCKPIVLNQAMRRCLYEVNHDVEILDLFIMCVGAQCGVSTEACETLKDSLPLRKCFPFQFDCLFDDIS